MKNKKLFIASILISILCVSFVSYEFVTTYTSHSTFEGYCQWRGLTVVNKSADFGYCQDENGNVFKMVLVNNRWYLDGDLPNNWPF